MRGDHGHQRSWHPHETRLNGAALHLSVNPDFMADVLRAVQTHPTALQFQWLRA
ncbi:hypothetical protein BOO71_0002200 [Deinococcus marmoris]|uniref:Uncharacterized protein n=1 Tax=Deinococcus marmoris TaxID=249408 RepID=A0A1U7P375_9DEIO|nr:hypothetical protein BOO71_0002200 [Deinococcus marmoris]